MYKYMKNSKGLLNCILSHLESKEVTIFLFIFIFTSYLQDFQVSFTWKFNLYIYLKVRVQLIMTCSFFWSSLHCLIQVTGYGNSDGNQKGADFTNLVYVPALFPLFYLPPDMIPGHLKQKKTFLSKETKGQKVPPPGKWQRRARDQKIAQALVYCCYCHITVFQPHLHP